MKFLLKFIIEDDPIFDVDFEFKINKNYYAGKN